MGIKPTFAVGPIPPTSKPARPQSKTSPGKELANSPITITTIYPDTLCNNIPNNNNIIPACHTEPHQSVGPPFLPLMDLLSPLHRYREEDSTPSVILSSSSLRPYNKNLKPVAGIIAVTTVITITTTTTTTLTTNPFLPVAIDPSAAIGPLGRREVKVEVAEAAEKAQEKGRIYLRKA